MNEQKRPSREFFQNIITTFAYSVIIIAVIGRLIGEGAKEISSLFNLGSEGLSYQALLQVFICSIVTGCLRTLLMSDLIFKKMMLLWRSVIMLLLMLVFDGSLAVLFRWFSLEDLGAWLRFIIAAIVCFLIGVAGMVMKMRLEDKKYDKLLSDYKLKNEESGDES